MNFKLLEILKNIKLSSIISTTNKTLNIVKKSIPVYKEIRPYVNKEKQLFKHNDEVIKDEIKESRSLKSKTNDSYNDSITFFQ